MGVRGQFLKKTEALYVEPNEIVEAATSGYFEQANSVPVTKNNHKI